MTVSQSPELGQLDWKHIVDQLDEATEFLPEHALRTCQQHPDQATPRLIEVLEEAASLGREGKVREGNATFLALVLLTEFQARSALPAVLGVYSLREPVLDGLLGDAVTEDPRRVLAVLAGDQPDLIEAMIPNQSLDEFIRWEAAAAICQLVRDEQLTRAEAIERLMRQLRAAIAAADNWALEILVSEIGQLNPLEAADEIKAAFDQGLLRNTDHTWPEFQKYSLHADQPGACPDLANWDEGPVHDTVEEIRGWYPPIDAGDELDDPEADEGWDEDDESMIADDLLNFPPPEPVDRLTIRHDGRRVGRNDPCPCGSGKKYKKCCLKAETAD